MLGVQEVRALPEQIPDETRAPADWHAAFSPAERRGYSGVGLYARPEHERVETSLDEPRFDAEGRFIAGHFRADGGGRFTVVNCYFPKGSGKDRDNSRVPYKLDFYRAVFDRAEELRREGPVLVIGDYNTAHREIDLARPKANVKNSGFLPEERAELDRWLDAGWTDTFRALHPDEPDHYSWWAQRGGAPRPQRRVAHRLRARIAGGHGAGAGRLHLAGRARLRPLPGRRRHRPLGGARHDGDGLHDRRRSSRSARSPAIRWRWCAAAPTSMRRRCRPSPGN